MPTVGDLKLAILTTTGLSIWEFYAKSLAHKEFLRKLNLIGHTHIEIPSEKYKVLFDEGMALVAKGGGNAGQKK